jgi:hypothetical protein
MVSLKQQLTIAAIGCVLFTVLFGYLLSVAVNRSLGEFERQSELIVPGSGVGNPPPQPF